MTESKFKKPKKETEISITGSGDVSEVGICIEPSTGKLTSKSKLFISFEFIYFDEKSGE